MEKAMDSTIDVYAEEFYSDFPEPEFVEEAEEITGDYEEESIPTLEDPAESIENYPVEIIEPVEPEVITVEEAEEIPLEATDDNITAWENTVVGEVANLSISGDPEEEIEESGESGTGTEYTQILTDMSGTLSGISDSLDMVSLTEKIDELNDNILILNQNLVIASQNDSLINKFQLGFIVAIFGALIIFFIMSKIR